MTMIKSIVDKSSDRAQSLHKGLLVLQSFSDGRSELTLSQVAENVGLNLATTRRFLLTLVDLGYLTMSNKRYSLTPKVLTLGYNYLSNLPWWQLANPVAEEISRKLHEPCSIGVLSNDQIIVVARAQGPRQLKVNLTPGRGIPVNTVSMGRVLLAELDKEAVDEFFVRNPPVSLTPYTVTNVNEIKESLTKVRAQGYAIVDQELDIGLLALAVPIRNNQGTAIAAIGVSTQTDRQSLDDFIKNSLPILQDGAKRITHIM